MDDTAIFLDSPHNRIRVYLPRLWDASLPTVAWLLWNPSLANDERDDRTITRVIEFSKRLGYGRADIVNLWPIVTPKPTELWAQLEAGMLTPEHHAENLRYVEEVSRRAQLRVVAFGGAAPKRAPEHVVEAVERFARGGELFCLKETKAGWPYHPFARGRYRLPDDCAAQPWSSPTPGT